MYKSKLQEVCHQKSWNLPEYTVTKQGQDHNPRFQATVTVNDRAFTTPNLCKSSKEAQNDAARIAYEHFTTPLPKPSPSRPAFPSSSCGSSSTSSVQMNILQTDQTPRVVSTTSVLKDDYGFRDQTARVNATISVHKDVFGSRDQTLQANGTTSIGKDFLASRDQTTLVNATSSVVKEDGCRSRGTVHLYKNQLQSYAQKRNLTFPIYSSEREGPPHASRFKSKVTVDGQTYESQQFFPTLKEAEHEAARVALMSLSPDGSQEDDCGFYKNLLQELAQKEGYALPIYCTKRSGEAHVPTFLSTVEVEGEVFTGPEAKTKKQAEMSAAKVAYLTLWERICKPKQSPTVLTGAHQAQVDHTSSTLQSNLTAGVHQKVQPTGHIVFNPRLILTEEDKVNGEVGSQLLLDPFPQPVMITNEKPESSMITNQKTKSSPSDLCAPSTPDSASSSSLHSDCCCNVVQESGTELGVGTDSSSSTRIRVFPRVPNMIFPRGSSVLRSDDNWVAIKLGSQSNQ